MLVGVNIVFDEDSALLNSGLVTNILRWPVLAKKPKKSSAHVLFLSLVQCYFRLNQRLEHILAHLIAPEYIDNASRTAPNQALKKLAGLRSEAPFSMVSFT